MDKTGNIDNISVCNEQIEGEINMKIENEITGHVKIHTSSRLKIELWIKDVRVDFFTLDLKAETVEIHLEKSTRVLIGMRQAYEDYVKLIADLGVEIPVKLTVEEYLLLPDSIKERVEIKEIQINKELYEY